MIDQNVDKQFLSDCAPSIDLCPFDCIGNSKPAYVLADTKLDLTNAKV